MTNELTFLGFDTYEDAKTFKKFLEREENKSMYESIMNPSYDEETKLYKVFFKLKTN